MPRERLDPEERKARKRARDRERYHTLRAMGICAYCGQTDAVPGHPYCPDCWEKMDTSKAKYLETHDEKEKPEKQRARYYERKAKGLCVRCSKPVTDGQIRCLECRARHRSWECKSRKGRTADEFKAAGICSVCKTEKAEAGYLCMACYNKCLKQLAKGRRTAKKNKEG